MKRKSCVRGIGLVLVLIVCTAIPARADHVVTDSLDRTVEVPDTAQRIVSGGLNITSTLAELVDADRLAAVDSYASDTRFSFVADTVAGVPTISQVQPETILSHDPDLVFLTPFTPAQIRQRIIEMDLPVIVVHETLSPGDINRNTQLIGSALHRQEQARELMVPRARETADTDEAFPGVVYYVESGVLPGRETLPSAIMKLAGVRNPLEKSGIRGWKSVPAELLLKLDPEWIVIDRINPQSTLNALKEDPVLSGLSAVRRDRILSFWPKYLTVSGPHLHQAIRFWRKQFSRVETRDE